MDIGKKVLVVDDDEDSRIFVVSIMEGEGWETLEACNGEEALDLVESEEPDLIIMDVSMPVMDGFEALRRLRRSPFTEEIPVIMLTGINEERGATLYNAAALESAFSIRGPEAFVDKPVDPDFLLHSIMGAIG